MKVKSQSEVVQSCPTLSDPTDCRLPGSSVHGVFQARVLECGAIAFSRIVLDPSYLRHLVYLNNTIKKVLSSYCHRWQDRLKRSEVVCLKSQSKSELRIQIHVIPHLMILPLYTQMTFIADRRAVNAKRNESIIRDRFFWRQSPGNPKIVLPQSSHSFSQWSHHFHLSSASHGVCFRLSQVALHGYQMAACCYYQRPAHSWILQRAMGRNCY